MKRNARKEPKRIPANYLRRQVYAYILKVGYQEFVDQWQHSFEPTAVNNTQLNILVFCAANVEPLHQKTYREQAEETTYLRTFKRISVIEICSGRFMTNYNGSNVEAQFWNVEYAALKKAVLIMQKYELDVPESKQLSSSTPVEVVSDDVIKTPSKDESLLHILQCYYEFIENVIASRQYPWFCDVTFALDPGNKFTTLTISQNYLEKIRDSIDCTMKDIDDKRTIAEQFSIEDGDTLDKIVSLIRSNR